MDAGAGLGIVQPGLGDGGFGGVVLAKVQTEIRRREVAAVLAMDGVVSILPSLLVCEITFYHGAMTGRWLGGVWIEAGMPGLGWCEQPSSPRLRRDKN